MPHGSALAGAAVLIAAYALGSIPVAWLVGRFAGGVDLRRLGSGNPGTSNLFRNTGMRLAILCGPLQFAQGALAVVVARVAGAGPVIVELAAVCAVVANGWPVWLRFNGQRAIAVATGAVAALNPVLLGVLLVCFAAGAMAHAIAVGVLAGFTVLPFAALVAGDAGVAATCAAFLAAIILRRLEGLAADRRAARTGAPRGTVLRRLLLDQRPGQVLVGARDETIPTDGR